MAMKSFRKELWFNLPTRLGFVNITPQVEACLQESGIIEGLSLISAMHITASVFINDDEVQFDFHVHKNPKAEDSYTRRIVMPESPLDVNVGFGEPMALVRVVWAMPVWPVPPSRGNACLTLSRPRCNSVPLIFRLPFCFGRKTSMKA